MATAAETLRAYGIVTPEVTEEEIVEAQAFGGELESAVWDNPLVLKFVPVLESIAKKAATASDHELRKVDVTARFGFLIGITTWTEDDGDFVSYALSHVLRVLENYTGFTF